VPTSVVRAHVEFAISRGTYPSLEQEFVAATRSMLLLLARRRSFLTLLDGIERPVLLLHGEKDRLVSVQTARAAARRNPSWRYEEAQDVGHVPQLEAPEWTLEQIAGWLGAQGASAARTARGTVRPALRSA
jgi:pimeloyl-ACP methyl ester carboxylesterase